MTQTYIQTQDNYSERLTTEITNIVGDFTFNVSAPPLYPRGIMLLGSPSNPDIVYYHRVSGNTIYVAGYNRRNAQTHKSGDPVKIGSVAEILNLYAKLVPTTFYPEVTGALEVTLFGGKWRNSGTRGVATSEVITIEDNTTTYIWFRFLDNTIQTSTDPLIVAKIEDEADASHGELLHIVTAALGTISSISTDIPKDFVDFNRINNGGVNELTPDLIDSYLDTLATAAMTPNSVIGFHKPGEPLDNKNTIAYLAQYIKDAGLLPEGAYGYVHNQASPATTWTMNHSLDSNRTILQFFSATVPTTRIYPNEVTFSDDSILVDWAGASVAGFCVIMTSSGIQATSSQPKITPTAGEALFAGAVVRMGITTREAGMNNSYVPDPIPSTFEGLLTGKVGYQSFKALRADLKKIQLYIAKTAAPDSTSVTVSIFAATTATVDGETRYVPTGSALATSPAVTAFNTTPAWTVFDISPNLTLTPGNFYIIKILTTGAETVKVFYDDDDVLTSTGYTYISDYNVIGDFLYKAQSEDTLAAEVAANVYLASAAELATTYFVGAVKDAVVAGSPSITQTHIADGLTGLDNTAPTKYLSDIPGQITDAPDTDSTFETEVGRFVGSTSIRLK